jgi:hypothetical protein
MKIQMRKEGKALGAALGRKKGSWNAVGAGEDKDDVDNEKQVEDVDDD